MRPSCSSSSSIGGSLKQAIPHMANVGDCCSGMGMAVHNTLITMYARCGSMGDARQVFETMRRRDVVSWTALIFGYADNGDGGAALEMFRRMCTSGCCTPNALTYIAALKGCVSLASSGHRAIALKRTKEVHWRAGCRLDSHGVSTLMDAYVKCGSMADAQRAFAMLEEPDVVSWTVLMLGYAANDDAFLALELFCRMKQRGCAPSAVTYVAALRACSSLAEAGDVASALQRGKAIHAEFGQRMDAYILSALVEMYAKCGRMENAQRAFDAFEGPDIVCWNALLDGYAENGEGSIALSLFSSMIGRSRPDSITYVAALKACTRLAGKGDKEVALRRGREIHLGISRCNMSLFVQNTLIDMYAKCGSMGEARRVFEAIHNPDVVSWNSLLLGYAENGEEAATVELFTRMTMNSCCTPNDVTYLALLRAYGSMGALSLGRKLSASIAKEQLTPHLVTCLVDFYARCGSLTEACEVYDEQARARELSTLNALLAGHARFGDCGFVFELFEAQQEHAGLRPDSITFLCLLGCCSYAGLVGRARHYFEGMLSQHGVAPDARHYSCMVDVLGRANQLKEAVGVVRSMPYQPTCVTWMALLAACRKWKNVSVGRWAFQSLLALDKKQAPAYVLMAQLYDAGRSMPEVQEAAATTAADAGTGPEFSDGEDMPTLQDEALILTSNRSCH